MKVKGLLLTTNKFEKVSDRINELGKSYYDFRKFLPVYLVEFNTGERGFLFNCDDKINPINLLGYGFEGLFNDDDRIKEIEEFGKYRCYIEEIDDDLDVTLTNLF